LGKLTAYIPDVVSLAGLSLLGFGLYMFEPWVSFSVCGALMILAGLRLGRSE
jgi:hypothetical protein